MVNNDDDVRSRARRRPFADCSEIYGGKSRANLRSMTSAESAGRVRQRKRPKHMQFIMA